MANETMKMAAPLGWRCTGEGLRCSDDDKGRPGPPDGQCSACASGGQRGEGLPVGWQHDADRREWMHTYPPMPRPTVRSAAEEVLVRIASETGVEWLDPGDDPYWRGVGVVYRLLETLERPPALMDTVRHLEREVARLRQIVSTGQALPRREGHPTRRCGLVGQMGDDPTKLIDCGLRPHEGHIHCTDDGLWWTAAGLNPATGIHELAAPLKAKLYLDHVRFYGSQDQTLAVLENKDLDPFVLERMRQSAGPVDDEGGASG